MPYFALTYEVVDRVVGQDPSEPPPPGLPT